MKGQEELIQETETVEEFTEQIEDESLTSLPLACANCIWRVDGDEAYEVCSGNCN